MILSRWLLAPSADEQTVHAIDERLGVGAFAASVLAARGMDADSAEAFLSEDQPLSDPFSYIDMDKAVAAIERAVDTGERITIYGDYDADGVTATSLLYAYLENLEADVSYYIPQRDGEGYGLNRKALEKLAKYGTKLLLTVDTGINAIDEAEYCRELGIELVVTDHHQPTERLPDAAAVVDPHRADCPSTFKQLCGAGVALQLVCALERSGDIAPYYADLAALGTVGDVVPLVGENRAIVRMGLERLAERDNIGIEALRQVAGLGEGMLTGEQLSFGLVPRINAAGRLGSAANAVNLLLADDEQAAAESAALINESNVRRRELEQEIFAEIETRLTAQPKLLQERVLVLSGAGWHHGVVGIVAARMVEKYGKPCLLIAEEGDMSRGSARSVGEFSMFRALCDAQDLLARFGGHAMAAGFSLRTADIPAFAERVCAYARREHPYMPAVSRPVDRAVAFSELTVENVASLSQLEPFGTGNESPQFALLGVRIDAVYPMGQGKHIRLKLSRGGENLYAVYFGMTPEAFSFGVGETVDVLFSAAPNTYNGETKVSVKIRELRTAGFDFDAYWRDRQIYEKLLRHELLEEAEYGRVLPTRDDVAVVYRYLKGAAGGGCAEDYERIHMRLPALPYCRLRVCVEILRELRLIAVREGRILVNPHPQRTNIESSRVLHRLRTIERVESK